MDLDVNPLDYLDPRVILTDAFPDPSCNIVACDGAVHPEGVIANAESVLKVIGGKLPL